MPVRWPCPFDVAANKSWKTLGDFGRNQANLLCECRCRHKGVVCRDRIARFYFLHRYPTATEVIHLHLRCHKCGGRPISIRPTWEKPTFPQWGADEAQWKRLQRRLRG